MDSIGHVLSLASQIYTLVEKVKANKKRCRRVADRVRALEKLLRSYRSREAGGSSADVEQALRELSITLSSAQQLIQKYTLSSWVERVLSSRSHGDEFSGVNERLNDAFQALAGAEQLQQGNLLSKVFELSCRHREDEDDRREDIILFQHVKQQQEKMDAMMRDLQELKASVETVVDAWKKPSDEVQVTRMIKAEELKFQQPKEPFVRSRTSEVYRGEYNGFQVAIKRYTGQVHASPREVREVFTKEVETMRRFESPNIQRVFGICIQDEDGPRPHFLIVMEYCEKGSLRQVLDSDCRLSWTRRASMSLDAAQGLYRLHQTEEKPKVHGCINSHKFLVSKGYTVKLGGFELAQTESSLRKSAKNQEARSLHYLPPQLLANIHHPYSKECEVYSFGIVLWEIMTRKKPFEGWSPEQIQQRVCVERFREPLPADCPAALRTLVDACRAYDSFHRPSAEELLDKLRTVVNQLEEQP
uniref:Mixed lineage kinase domain like pseudokinase n=1 Tax=Tetraodon nigroviridis TaxID=99883 RepID=H3CYJ1_TETNG